MTISVDYSQFPYLITIPQSDLTLVTGNQYKITVAELWVLQRDYADSEEALPFPIIYTNVPPTESGTPRIVEINENYYMARFEGVGTNNTTGFSTVETGVSGLTAEESGWLSSVPTIEVDMAFLKYSLKGEKSLVKVSSTWYLRIWDTNSPRALILDKALKDANGNEIDDLAAGALAQELGNTA